MNEITRIHIGGVAYEIDLSAKKDLEKYLTAIKKSLGSDADAMEDIEIRITELLADRGVTKDSVITEYDLKAVREKLGEPQDFSSEDHKTDAADPDKETIAEKINKTFTDKKFYRDPDNAILGGIVAGLSAYTGWDVTLLRLLLVILTFISFGFFVIAYIVVWIIAPAANSTSEKLEMHGRPVNIDSIKKSAKEFSHKAQTSTKKAAHKAKTATKNMAEKVENTAEYVATNSAGLGYTIGRIISIFFGLIGIIISFAILTALAAAAFWTIRIILDFTIPSLPLVIATASTLTLALLFLSIFGINLSISMLTGSFGNGRKKPGLVISIILAFALFASSITTSAIWIYIHGAAGIQNAANVIEERIDDFRY